MRVEYRSLGRSGLEVSEIGFGAWAIGGDAWGPVEDDASIAAMQRALELGINFIDTADVYGDGHSEELVAQVIKGRRDQVIVSTKGGLMGHHRDPSGTPVYDRPEKVREALENSLRRLGTDYVDVYFDHIWWDRHEETEAFIEALAQLKAEGKARAVGVSTDDFEYIKHFNKNGGLDVVQLEYSVLNRKAEREILPYLQEHGIGVVVRGPLQKGLLTGKFTSDTTFPKEMCATPGRARSGTERTLGVWRSCGTLKARGRRWGSWLFDSCSATPLSPRPSLVARRLGRWRRTPELHSARCCLKRNCSLSIR